MQLQVSPYIGAPAFSRLEHNRTNAPIDLVSLADLLRNSFVYPPHSILEGIGALTYGFDETHAATSDWRYVFPFPEASRSIRSSRGDEALLSTYHRLLCEAVATSTRGMRRPWLLQSGGKDSTTLAIAMAEARPDATCLTYLGGREEDELESASRVARHLGLRHEQLTCDVGRAYDRYLALAGRLPLLTADFALLSYVDLATEIDAMGGDGIIDGLGSDIYFGVPMDYGKRLLLRLARGCTWPARLAEVPLLERSFMLCFLLGSLQMEPAERNFPGSRFTDAEVDALLGFDASRQSRARLAPYEPQIASAANADERRTIHVSIFEGAAGFAKGLYTAHALPLEIAYPFCDRTLRNWIHYEVPKARKTDSVTRRNKMLVREHIATRFGSLPYVVAKGSFRFDLVGLAERRFGQVHAFADAARDVLPGAAAWLERNRGRLGNKYHASKFYLLAVVLPWILRHHDRAGVHADGTN
jgi:asparagine synthetase B (glutamine-hydrolysing)